MISDIVQRTTLGVHTDNVSSHFHHISLSSNYRKMTNQTQGSPRLEREQKSLTLENTDS